jgi:peptidylprolyl isomerase/peptidyl-prolyl cis-trans isomerase B (cyclophilin B)
MLFLLTLALVACNTGQDPAAANEAVANEPTPTAGAAATDTPVAATPAPPEAAPAVTAGAKVPPPAELAEGAASKLEPAARNDMYTAPPEMTIDETKYYYATFKTDHGDIKVQLFADRAPKTVNNFVFLSREGYYNNTVFHRVLDGFMAQAGDPTGTGAGGPGYEFGDEFFPGLVFDRPGLLAMANRGPGTNGSQFFITFAPTDWLNNLHTIFGEVTEGQDVLNSLTRRDPNGATDFPGDTLYTVLIEEGESSVLATPSPPPPTATATQTPTPFAPNAVENNDRPLSKVEPAARVNYFNTAPDMVIDTAKQYTATIKTSKGELVVELYDDVAPIAVNNFVVLANLGFYDGLPINQNAPNNVVIVGSPDNNPQSDVGYRFTPEVNLPISLTVGAMAFVPLQQPTGEVVASGSQLLIAQIVPPADANQQFGFFGRIVRGFESLAPLTTEDKIESLTITEE